MFLNAVIFNASAKDSYSVFVYLRKYVSGFTLFLLVVCCPSERVSSDLDAVAVLIAHPVCDDAIQFSLLMNEVIKERCSVCIVGEFPYSSMTVVDHGRLAKAAEMRHPRFCSPARFITAH